ncbi:MAG: ABC-F family ATP-binding cassette domain-containing protein [Acidimicrobiales bacterium]|nr:ABC-F family ATP-binding cassette domain-containing protein [Acidimicrobiales bacterium]
MILVDAESVTMTRPGRPLFETVSVTIETGDRIGLVGLNGTGKSTLIDVLIGEREAESGVVRGGRDVRVAALRQDPDLGNGTIRDAVTSADGETWEMDAVLDRLGMGGRADEPVAQLSGGEAKRVALARALVRPCDLLVLDEPTNHLDVDAIAWLEDRLATFKGGLLLVTHDRHVLDRVTNRVLELDRGKAYVHEGGYDAYLEGRALREEQAEQAERVRKNLARTELAWLRRGAPARTSKAKARIRTATELVTSRPEAAARSGELDLHFGTPRLGNDVVDLDGVGFRFDDAEAPLFESVMLSLDPRERLGIVGANGTGKSTLLDVISGRRTPTSGKVSVGSTVRMELFDQRGIELDPRKRVWEAVVGGDKPKPDWQDKALMESFWFDSDAQYAPIELLSGGERRRLQLLMTLARKPNVLLLDEPTNDLDLDTLRVLEDFLENFPGAVVVVSHDRAFLERTVDDVIVFDGGGTVSRMPGGYEAYERLRRAATAPAKGKANEPRVEGTAAAKPKPGGGRSHSTIRHELKEAEKAMAKLEKRQAKLNAELEAAATSGDHQQMATLGPDLNHVLAEISDVEERWLALSEELEGV